MSKYLIALFLMLPSIAFSQEAIKLEFPILCLSETKASELVNKYNEVAMLQGISHREVAGKDFEHPIVLFMNIEKRTFTMLERIGDDVSNFKYCIISYGGKMKPSSFDKNTPIE